MLTPTRLVRLAVAAALAAGASPALAASASEQAVRRAASAFAEFEKADVAKLSTQLQRLVQDPKVIEPFLAKDREKLLAAAKPTFERMKTEEQITHWYFIEPNGTCFLRVHGPGQFGDVIARDTFKQAAATGDVGFGKELGKTAFALRVVRPIRWQGKLVGYMELGEEIDHFFERMKAATGDDFGLLVAKEHVDRKELARVRNDDRWDERPDVVLINSTMWDEKGIQVPVALEKLPADGVMIPEWQDQEKRFVGGVFPVKNAVHHVVGAIYVRHLVSAKAAPASAAK